MTALMGLAHCCSRAQPWEQPPPRLPINFWHSRTRPGAPHQSHLSSISTDDIPAIRQLLEQDLRVRGVTASGAESANTVRVTLSESAHDRLWVAEVVEGDQTQVAVVDLGTESAAAASIRRRIHAAERWCYSPRPNRCWPHWNFRTPSSLLSGEIVIYAHAKDGCRTTNA